MNRTRKLLWSAAIVILMVGVVLTTMRAYSARQLQALKSQVAYPSLEDGVREMIASYYSGVDKVEIAYADKEIFDDLWFVEVHVWAAGRRDGKEFSGRDYDNPGWYFLRLQDGWVFVPEGKLPAIITFGKRLLKAQGS